LFEKYLVSSCLRGKMLKTALKGKKPVSFSKNRDFFRHFFDPFRSFRGQLIHQSFFEPVDGEKADDKDEYNNIKRVEQEIPVILAGANSAGKSNGMSQW
jgi:hypothetical protein